MAEHTPTPWHVYEKDPFVICEGGGGSIGIIEAGYPGVSEAEQIANAAYVVHCVNVHDDLVTALEQLWDYARSLEKVIRDGVYQSEELNNPDAWKDADSFAYNGDGASMRDVVTAALARAKGGEG